MTQVEHGTYIELGPRDDELAQEVLAAAGRIAANAAIESPPCAYGYTIEYDDQGGIAGTYSNNFQTGISTQKYYRNGELASSVKVDRGANTHTMTLHQRNGDVTFVSPYAGPEGWVSHAPVPTIKN